MPSNYTKDKIRAARFCELCVWAVGSLLRPFLTPKLAAADRCERFAIVLLEPFHLGDVLSLSVMFDPLLAAFPQCRLVVWCNSKNAHVYQNDPRVDQIVSSRFFWSNRISKRGNPGEWLSVLRGILAMRTVSPAIGIDTRGEIRNQVLLYASGCKRRIGFINYFGSNMIIRGLLLTDNLGYGPIEHRYLSNLRTLTPLLGIQPRLQIPALHAHSPLLNPTQKRLVIHIGAGLEYKLWNPTRWARLINTLSRVAGLEVLLLQGPGEEALITVIQKLLAAPVLTKATTYTEMLDILTGATLFLGLDSGPMNAACLLGVPAIALFGPGDPQMWHPLGENSRAIHNLQDDPCRLCIKRNRCVRYLDRCMDRISVEEVETAAFNVLRSLGCFREDLIPQAGLESVKLATIALTSGLFNPNK